jgi:hypothetical protein
VSGLAYIEDALLLRCLWDIERVLASLLAFGGLVGGCFDMAMAKCLIEELLYGWTAFSEALPYSWLKGELRAYYSWTAALDVVV